MSASVTIMSMMAVWRLGMTSWLLVCLCWHESECVQLMPMCGNAMFAPYSRLSTQGPGVASMIKRTSPQPRRSSDPTRFLILSYRPPSKGPDAEQGTPRVKKSTAGRFVSSLVSKTGRSSGTSTTWSQSSTTQKVHLTTNTTTKINGRGAPRTNTPNPKTSPTLTTPTTTAYSGQAMYPCVCVISTLSKFSLYVIHESPPDKALGETLQVADGCRQSGYSLEDLKSDPVLNFNDETKNSLCSNTSISLRVTTHVTLSLLLTFEEGTDNLTVRCGGQSSLQPQNQGERLPNVKVIPRNGGNNKTDDVIGKEQPDRKAPRRSGVSTSALPLMIVAFICLVSLMLAMAFFLLWQRSNLDNRPSPFRRKGQREKKRQEENNYEEISDVYATQTRQSKKEAEMKKSTNPDIQRQVSTVSSRKTDLHSTSTNSHGNNYKLSQHSSDKEMSFPDGGNVLSMEYCVAKDSLTIKPRPLLRVPSNCPSLGAGLASYEDLPYRHHSHTKISHTADKSTPFARSTPEIPSTCRPTDHERSKSVSGLSAIGYHSHRPERNWPSRNSTQTGYYFELQRRNDSGSLDVSKVALYESMLNTGDASCASTCSSRYGRVGQAGGMSDYQSSSIRGLSEGSLQAGECPTHEEDHTYEDVTDDIKTTTDVGEILRTEKNDTIDGEDKKENQDKPILKPRTPVHRNPCIIDVSEFTKSPKVNNQTWSTSPSVVLFPNTASCQDPDLEKPNNYYHTVSEDCSKKSPCQGDIIEDNNAKGYHNHDDGMVMIENDINRSRASHHQGGECPSQPGTIMARKGADSGITLNDHDEDDDDDDDDGGGGQCGNCHDTSKTTGASAITSDKSQCHTVMIENSIYQSTGRVRKDVATTCGPFTDITVCGECDSHTVMVENSIYHSTRL